MVNWLKIIFKPKSILGLLVAVGFVFLAIGGAAMTKFPDVAAFFTGWGKFGLFIGLAGWSCYIIPAVVRNWRSAFG